MSVVQCTYYDRAIINKNGSINFTCQANSPSYCKKTRSLATHSTDEHQHTYIHTMSCNMQCVYVQS